jgi:hypothetical protein
LALLEPIVHDIQSLDGLWIWFSVRRSVIENAL